MNRAAIVAVVALTVALSGCALNPFCSVLLAGDFCWSLYRINDKPSPHPAIPPVKIPASGGGER
jgi:energy-converting hydrogenase Eha subunit C